MRHGLEMRLGMKISGRHSVMIWRIEHAGDLLANDGKTGYQIPLGMKVMKFHIGEKVHYRL